MLWIVIRKKSASVGVLAALILMSPVTYVVGSYYLAQARHKKDCTENGGLRMFARIEKSDRIRLDINSYIANSDAEYLLKGLHPSLMKVEGWDGRYTGNGNRTGYFTYFINPDTIPLSKALWEIEKTPLSAPSQGIYMLSEIHEIGRGIEKVAILLSLDGRPIASATMFTHYWWANSFSNVAWRCYYSTEEGESWMMSLARLVSKQ